MGLIPSAFQGRKRKSEEEVALLVASLFYLRKQESLKVIKAADVNEQKDQVIVALSEAEYGKGMGFCLCFDYPTLESVFNDDLKLLLLKSLASFKEASAPQFVLDFVYALNRQEFQEGELLSLYDKSIKELYYLKRETIAQPREITKLASYFIKDNTRRILDPFGGFMDFATTMPEKEFVGFEINELTRNLALFRMALAGADQHSTLLLNSAEYWTDEVFDAIVTFPPFACKLDMKDTIFGLKDEVDHAVLTRFEKTTSNQGQLVMVVPLSTLFKEYSGMKDCREKYTKLNWIDTIVSLPAGIFQSTQIETAILVLNKSRKPGDRIRFVDASECLLKNNTRKTIDYAKVIELIEHTDGKSSFDVTQQDILGQNSSWLVGWYQYLNLSKLYHNDEHTVPFKDVFERAETTTQFKEKEGRVVTTDILTQSTQIRYEYQPEDFELSDDLKSARKITEPVLLTSFGTLFFPVYCNASDDNPIFIKTSAIGAYTIKSNSNHIGYLCFELFRRFAELSIFVSSFSNKRLYEQIELSIPSFAEQKRFFEETKRSEQEKKIKELDLQKTIDGLIADSKKQLRERKHSLMQNSSSLASDWDDLKDYLLNNKGRFDENDTIHFLHPVKIGDLINTITENIKIMENKIYHLTDEDIDWGPEEEIDLQEFIKTYIRSHKNARYGFEFEPKLNVNLEAADQTGIVYYQIAADWKVLIPKKALQQVFDNIVSNAKAHGFIDKRNGNYIIKFDFYYTFNTIVLEISNNGKALDDGVDTEFIRRNGSSTKLNVKDENGEAAHSGTGGHEADSILSKYNATMEVESDPDALFTVTYRIEFKNIKDTIVKGEVPDF